MEAKTSEIISYLKEEYSKIRANRPSPKLVEHVKMDCMGTEMPIGHLATISVSPPRDIIVSPWDKSIIPAMTKAIESVNLGLGISADSTSIRLTMSDLGVERIRELEKFVKSIAEECRIRMRTARDKIMKDVNSLTEDEKFRAKDKIQKIVDRFNSDVDSLISAKYGELNS